MQSILNNSIKPSKIVLSLYKEDYSSLTKKIKKMIIKYNIELIITDKDLEYHNKYFEVMKKYRDHAIITIDDNIIYTNDLIETLFNSYTKYPNCIHAELLIKL